jgi:quercetin dioxygenase-like cupin family protein
MTLEHAYVPDLAKEAQFSSEKPTSRILYSTPRTKVVLMALEAGQELAPHASPRPVVLHFLSGSGFLRFDQDEHAVGAGTWMVLPAGLNHGLRAESPLVFLLTTPSYRCLYNDKMQKQQYPVQLQREERSSLLQLSKKGTVEVRAFCRMQFAAIQHWPTVCTSSSRPPCMRCCCMVGRCCLSAGRFSR